MSPTYTFEPAPEVKNLHWSLDPRLPTRVLGTGVSHCTYWIFMYMMAGVINTTGVWG